MIVTPYFETKLLYFDRHSTHDIEQTRFQYMSACRTSLSKYRLREQNQDTMRRRMDIENRLGPDCLTASVKETPCLNWDYVT